MRQVTAMPKREIFVHAQKKVAKAFRKGELDRLVRAAVAAAEKSKGWAEGEEFVYEIEDEEYVIDGVTNSTLTVCHVGSRYEVYYYDGATGTLFT